MSNVRVRLLVLFAILLVAVATAAAFLYQYRFKPQPPAVTPAVQGRQGVRLEIPNAAWEPAFYQSLSERTQKANLPSLRTVVLTPPDLEVRYWFDSHPDVINGFVIRQSNRQWSAIGLRQTNDHHPFEVKVEDLGVPQSGWRAFWIKLEQAGILTLPDGSAKECNAVSVDGWALVVETNVNQIYRTYHYSNPQIAKCDEAKRILSMDTIIADEFRLPGPKQ